MHDILKPIELTQHQEEMLLEMAQKLFNFQHIMVWRERNIISLNSWSDKNIKGTNISWLEFCLLYIAPKLKIEPLWTENIFKDIFFEAIHPIDYLYIEYLKETNETSNS